MRFASVFAIFLTALCSLLLIFGCYKEENAGKSMDEKLTVMEQQTASYRVEIEALKTKINELTVERDAAKAELAILEVKESYKKNPTAFLTFDEGFSQNTVDVINILNQNGIRGTFFVIGKNIENNPSMQAALKAASDAGHAIGIRAYSNTLSEVYASEEAYFADLYKCRDLIFEITGKYPTLVRMPAGTATAASRFKRYTGSDDVFEKVLNRLLKEGYMVNDWTVDTQNATVSNIDNIVSDTLSQAERTLSAKTKTCVILFSDNSRMQKALPAIIAGLDDLDFNFATLPPEFCITRQR